MASFARELDALIAKHLGTPKWGNDLLPIAGALHAAAERNDAEAAAIDGMMKPSRISSSDLTGGLDLLASNS